MPTMVFDEVDAGVGGRAAIEVGRRLARLARDHQVIVVTHLAQVAAFADRHIVVDKPGQHQHGVTSSDVRVVDGADRVAELARMLAGTDSETAREHAAELLASAAADRADDGTRNEPIAGRSAKAGQSRAQTAWRRDRLTPRAGGTMVAHEARNAAPRPRSDALSGRQRASPGSIGAPSDLSAG